MERYEFHDLNVNERGDPSFIPPEAMFIVDHGVGIPIEDMIDGYQTLNVSGRELMAYSVNSVDVTGIDGAIYQNANYSAREITITYLLETNSDQEFREKYSKLNSILNQKQFRFYFFDDTQFEYVGTLSHAETPEPGFNTVKSEFTIVCPNPYKRLRETTIYKGKGSIRINEPADFPTTPDEIDVELGQNTNRVVVSNGSQSIRLNGDLKAGNRLVLKPEADYDQSVAILLNGKNALNLLELDSDFENFKVSTGTKVEVNPNSNLTVKLRRLSM